MLFKIPTLELSFSYVVPTKVVHFLKSGCIGMYTVHCTGPFTRHISLEHQVLGLWRYTLLAQEGPSSSVCAFGLVAVMPLYMILCKPRQAGATISDSI